MDKTINQIIEKNSFVKEACKKYGREVWKYLIANLIDSNFFLNKRLYLPHIHIKPLSTDHVDEVEKIEKHLDENLQYLHDLGSDYNIISDFLAICKTENYKNKAVEILKVYGSFIQSNFSKAVIEGENYNHTTAGLCWLFDYSDDFKTIREVKKEFKRQCELKSNNKSKSKKWVD